ncbi:MAG: hypothetical protein EAY75_00020 [Bacteroidetes bacterium]|nr:MAG: hypothetical protein EAY75_00020 [Bacteroidota bacterium]
MVKGGQFRLMKKAKKTTTAPAKPLQKTNAAPNGSRDYAFMLFMQRVPQQDIAQRCQVSQQTISAWKTKDNWEAKRASKTISMDALVGPVKSTKAAQYRG